MEEMSRCLSRRELLAALLLFTLLILLTPSALGARHPADNRAWSNADATLTVK